MLPDPDNFAPSRASARHRALIAPTTRLALCAALIWWMSCVFGHYRSLCSNGGLPIGARRPCDFTDRRRDVESARSRRVPPRAGARIDAGRRRRAEVGGAQSSSSRSRGALHRHSIRRCRRPARRHMPGARMFGRSPAARRRRRRCCRRADPRALQDGRSLSPAPWCTIFARAVTPACFATRALSNRRATSRSTTARVPMVGERHGCDDRACLDPSFLPERSPPRS